MSWLRCEKSRTMSNGGFGETAWLVTIETVIVTSVSPSAGARAASSAPMLPDAPTRLSTTTGWPSTPARRAATVRVVRSLPPPAANGEIQRTGRSGCEGWAGCAAAGTTNSAAATLQGIAQAVAQIERLIVSFGVSSEWVEYIAGP